MGGSRKDTSAGRGPCSKRSKVDVDNYRGSLTQTASREHLPITKEYDGAFDEKFYSTFYNSYIYKHRIKRLWFCWWGWQGTRLNEDSSEDNAKFKRKTRVLKSQYRSLCDLPTCHRSFIPNKTDIIGVDLPHPWYDFKGKDNDKNYHICAGKKDTRTF